MIFDETTVDMIGEPDSSSFIQDDQSDIGSPLSKSSPKPVASPRAALSTFDPLNVEEEVEDIEPPTPDYDNCPSPTDSEITALQSHIEAKPPTPPLQLSPSKYVEAFPRFRETEKEFSERVWKDKMMRKKDELKKFIDMVEGSEVITSALDYACVVIPHRHIKLNSFHVMGEFRRRVADIDHEFEDVRDFNAPQYLHDCLVARGKSNPNLQAYGDWLALMGLAPTKGNIDYVLTQDVMDPGKIYLNRTSHYLQSSRHYKFSSHFLLRGGLDQLSTMLFGDLSFVTMKPDPLPCAWSPAMILGHQFNIPSCQELKPITTRHRSYIWIHLKEVDKRKNKIIGGFSMKLFWEADDKNHHWVARLVASIMEAAHIAQDIGVDPKLSSFEVQMVHGSHVSNVDFSFILMPTHYNCCFLHAFAFECEKSCSDVGYNFSWDYVPVRSNPYTIESEMLEFKHKIRYYIHSVLKHVVLDVLRLKNVLLQLNRHWTIRDDFMKGQQLTEKGYEYCTTFVRFMGVPGLFDYSHHKKIFEKRMKEKRDKRKWSDAGLGEPELLKDDIAKKFCSKSI